MVSTAEIVTAKHIVRVRDLLEGAAKELQRRGEAHDQSKFTPEEMGPLKEMQAIIDREGQAPFGSDEYKRRTALLKPMLVHHYARNSHHPEHYSNGVAGMDLFDLMEMFFDWKAASERGEDPAMNISTACERFKVEPMLCRIFENTADRLGYRRV